MHVISGLNMGGAEMSLKRLVESHLDNPAYRHVVISLTDMGKFGSKFQAMGVQVHALGMRSVFSVPFVLWRLIRLIRMSRPDIVQTWMYHADLLGGVAARMAGQNNVIWGIRITSVPASNFLTVLVMKVCALTSRWIPRTIVCVAEAAKKKHIDYGYDASRMVVVHNGIVVSKSTTTDEQRVELRKACGFSEEDMVVGWIGRFHPDKGQDNFVGAAKIIANNYPKAKFMLVGRNCDTKNEQLMEWLKEYRLQDRFALLGERDDISLCLAVIDIFCMPSRNEGFPNALAEAMVMALPCVATDAGDAAMLLADTGVVVPKEDSLALAQGVGQLLAMDQNARHKLGMLAKARIEADFSMVRARERFEEIYRQVIDKGDF